MSLGSILSVARTAIFAHQTAAEVVSHNIANADTEGYSRQRAQLTAGTPTVFTYGSVGTGVFVDGVQRVRQQALDINYRQQSGNAEGAATRRDLLSEVQGIFGEPQDQGLAEGLDAFWSAWSDLANTPGNAAAQAVVRQRGANVAETLNRYDSQLADVEKGTSGRLSTSIGQVNDLAQRMADLNVQITAAEADGHEAPDLRDARDRVADDLAKLVGARTVPQANGTYAVVVGGTTLVDGANARPAVARSSANGWIVTVGSSPDAVNGIGGSTGGLLAVVNDDLPQLRAKLDALAKGVVNGVNFLHRQGWTAAGDALGNADWTSATPASGSRVDFFDAGRTTAATIRLSDEVTADANVVAAGFTHNGPGDNALALQLSSLRDVTGMRALESSMDAGLGAGTFASTVGIQSGVSYDDQYRDSMTRLGLDVSNLEGEATAFDALSTQAAKRREEVFGVSIDEELTLLMRHQQAFSAASHLVKVVDEMMQTVIGMV